MSRTLHSSYCQEAWCDNRMKTMRDFLVWYNNRDVVPFLEAIDKQFAFYRQQNIDMFKDGISVPGLTLLYMFNDLPPNIFFTVFNLTNKDLHHLVKDNIVGGPAIIFHRYHEKNVTKLRNGEPCKSIVGYDANALYLWALMQDMHCGWYTRRREEKQFHPQPAQPYGQMAAQWLTSVSSRSGRIIRHQSNGREKRVGKLLVDGWCTVTRTAYQFHGCYFHGCSNCYGPQDTNALNGKTMARLLEETKKNTAYLRRHVKVVEMWECQWKRESKALPRPKWNMTQSEILADVVNGTLFGMVECDVHVPPDLRKHFFRDATHIQERNSVSGRYRSVHEPVRRRAQHPCEASSNAYWQLSRQQNLTDHTVIEMVPRTRASSLPRLPSHRIRSESMLSTLRRVCLHSPTCR